MILKRLALVLVLAFGVPPALAAGAPRVLTWEEMMPPGEQERIDEMFEKLMQQLNAQAAAAGQLGDGAESAPPDLSAMTEGLPGVSADALLSDAPVQIGTFNVVPELDGQAVRLPGYVVPLDLDAQNELREFLLVPYFGACIHVPPPPPNQTLYIKSEQPVTIKDIDVPIWVEGVLTTAKHDSDLADAAYSLALSKVEIYKE
jgi:hypothetical protein